MADMFLREVGLERVRVRLPTGTAGAADVPGITTAAWFFNYFVVAVLWISSKMMYDALRSRFQQHHTHLDNDKAAA